MTPERRHRAISVQALACGTSTRLSGVTTRSSERVLSRAEIEKSGLGQRIQRLHHILRARYPFLNRIALALYDPESDLLKTFASSTQRGQTLSHYEAPLSGVPSLQRLRDLRQARVVDDIAASFTAPTLHTDWLKARHYRSSYTRPLYRGQDLAADIMRQVVGGHHERGNGSGYPRRLHMAQIHLPARIVAVADVFDALSCSRPHEQTWPESRCLEELHRQAEQGLLNAHCVQALIEAQEERRSIQQRFAD